MGQGMDELRTRGRGQDISALVEALRSTKGQMGVISERAMADQFNVKRHQLRRALQVLRDAGELGPIETRRKSIDVRQSEALARDTNPVEVIEIRLALEPSLARLAAVRASSLDISRILKTASTSVKSDSGSADLAFHRSIAAATGNRLASGLYSLLRQVGSNTRVRMQRKNPECPDRIKQRDAEHRAIAECIAARDPDGAEKAMRNHLLAVQRLVVERLLPIAEAG